MKILKFHRTLIEELMVCSMRKIRSTNYTSDEICCCVGLIGVITGEVLELSEFECDIANCW